MILCRFMWRGKWIYCVWEHSADSVNEGTEIISRTSTAFVTKYEGDQIGQTGLEGHARRWKIIEVNAKAVWWEDVVWIERV